MMLKVAVCGIGRRAVVGREAEKNLAQVRIGDAALDLGGQRARGGDFTDVAELPEVAGREGSPNSEGGRFR